MLVYIYLIQKIVIFLTSLELKGMSQDTSRTFNFRSVEDRDFYGKYFIICNFFSPVEFPGGSSTKEIYFARTA